MPLLLAGAAWSGAYTSDMTAHQPGIGNRIAPPRFLAFGVATAGAVPVAVARFGWSTGVMIGFDVAAAVFLLSVIPLLSDVSADAMRAASRRNDANRPILLGVTGATSVAILAAVTGELAARGGPSVAEIALVIATLGLSWLFANAVYALHYAHVYYVQDTGGGDVRGLDFPSCDEPDYWDFLYFAFTLGMTFQTSDIAITDRGLRRTVTLHALAAFVFNLGIVAFAINVAGGS